MKISQLTQQIVGSPYLPCGQNAQTGMDCFTLIIDYLRRLGEDIPHDLKYKGYTFDTYYKAYEKNHDVLDIGIEYISEKTEKIRPIHVISGDILVVEKEGKKSMVIDGGNGNIVAATKEKGITILKKSDFKVLKAFRWQRH